MSLHASVIAAPQPLTPRGGKEEVEPSQPLTPIGGNGDAENSCWAKCTSETSNNCQECMPFENAALDDPAPEAHNPRPLRKSQSVRFTSQESHQTVEEVENPQFELTSPMARRLSKQGENDEKVSNSESSTGKDNISNAGMSNASSTTRILRAASLGNLAGSGDPYRPSSFIQVEQQPPPQEAGAWGTRQRLAIILSHPMTEILVSTVIVFNFLLILLDTDARTRANSTPFWIETAMGFCLAVFVLEICLRFLVEGPGMFRNTMNKLDMFIVAVGLAEYVLDWIGLSLTGLSVTRAARIVRLLRLLRMVRLFSSLRELRKLIQMIASCFKTLFWCFFLLTILMTVWAIIAVELLNPLMPELISKGAYKDCGSCADSFSSVLRADMTFFQTLVASDRRYLSIIAMPMIEAFPWTAIVYVGSLVTLVFGVLNLVVAVIVDTFAERRSKDIIGRAVEMDFAEAQEKKVLSQVFAKIDTDQSGSLCYTELEDGARRVAEFRHWLRVLDIDTHDLKELFSMLDAEDTGEIDPEHFIEALYRLKNTESKTATRLVKHKVEQIDQRLNEFCSFEAERGQNHYITIYERLREQEVRINKTIEVAINKATDVAREAALKAGMDAAKNVMTSVAASSDHLIEGVNQRVHNQSNPGNRNSRTHVRNPKEVIQRLLSRSSSKLSIRSPRKCSERSACEHQEDNRSEQGHETTIQPEI